MRKKILAVVAAVTLCALTVFIFADKGLQTPKSPLTVSVSNETVYQNETVSVPVTVENNPGLAACYVRVAYDAAALELADVISSGLFEDFLSFQDNGSIILSWEGTLTGDGKLADLVFRPLCESGTVLLTLTPYLNGFVNAQATEVAAQCENGSVTVAGTPAVKLPAGAQWLDNTRSVYWSVSEDVLTVGGHGKIPARATDVPAPWSGQTVKQILLLGGITEVGDNAFADCADAESILLPGTVNALGKNAFGDALVHITVEGEVPPAASADTFASCTSLQTVTVPPGLLDAYKNAPGWDAVSAAFEQAPVTFAGISLTLNGTLGLNFYMRLTDEAASSGTMRFALAGKDGARTAISVADSRKDGAGRYIFTCRVSAIQMADAVTAAFSYQGGQTVTKSTDVAAYLNNLVYYSGADAPLVTLAKAIADYGHYAQISLAAERGWALGEDHAAIACFGTPETALDLSSHAVESSGSAAGIMGTGRSVVLDSGTDLCLFVQCDGSHPLAPHVSVLDGDGVSADFAVEKEDDSVYRVTVGDIAAHRLGEKFTVTLDNTLQVKLSVLSYAHSILTAGDSSADECNAVAALYAYYTAALNYAVQE